MKKIISLLLFYTFLCTNIANAVYLEGESAFRRVIKVEPINVAVPSVVVFIIPSSEDSNFYVKDNEEDRFIGSMLIYIPSAELGANPGYTRELRFLAQPNHSYNIYYQADRPVSIRTDEIGNLKTIEKKIIVGGQDIPNEKYAPADVDGDGVRDVVDNCVQVSNSDQLDLDDSGIGDECEDFDGDDISNADDNCPNHPNRNQTDEDMDEKGDVCDEKDNRIIETSPWVPWVGIGIAGLVILILFVLVAQNTKPRNDTVLS